MKNAPTPMDPPPPSARQEGLEALSYDCVICRRPAEGGRSESLVPCNVRAFAAESFRVWRCPTCRCVHARDPVDLDSYYAEYPFLSLSVDWRVRALYAEQLRRLRQVGVREGQRILDYGCGSGELVRFLRDRGHPEAVGFDKYSSAFSRPDVLRARYDCVIAQDVIEHVADPHQLLDELIALTRPGGVLFIGTPNAEALDLERPSHYKHALHMPYHRHILGKTALVQLGEQRGLQLRRYYPTQYANTRIPFLNSRFYRFFMQQLDDTLDCLMDPPRLGPLLARLPRALFLGFFGSWLAEETDIAVAFGTGR